MNYDASETKLYQDESDPDLQVYRDFLFSNLNGNSPIKIDFCYVLTTWLYSKSGQDYGQRGLFDETIVLKESETDEFLQYLQENLSGDEQEKSRILNLARETLRYLAGFIVWSSR